MASRREMAATGFPYTSAQAFTVVSPTRTPVNDPGPAVTAYAPTSLIDRLASLRRPFIAGRSQDEYSSLVSWGINSSTDSSRSSATLPRESQVSIARTITYALYPGTESKLRKVKKSKKKHPFQGLRPLDSLP